MTTTYPGTIQTFTDPSGTSQLASGPDHAQLHTDINDTVEAIQHTIGTTSGTAILQGITEVSTDGTMGGDSDTAIPTEKAVKAYVDGKIIDEDDMASDSATKVPTQQSVKAYVDASAPVGKNYLINGNFDVSQRATTFVAGANNDDVYTLDRWNLISDGNDVLDVSQETVTDLVGSDKAIKLDVETSARAGIVQILEQKDTALLRGQTVSLSFKVKSANISALRAAILTWAGTADTVTSDVVGTWAATPTWAANWTAENTPADLTVTSDWTTVKIEGIAIDSATVNNLAVVIWTPNEETIGDIVYISGVKLEIGTNATAFIPNTFEEEIRRCRRYFIRNVATNIYGGFFSGVVFSTTSAVCSYNTAIPMRTAPTIAYSGTIRALDGNSNNITAMSYEGGASTGQIVCTTAGGLTSGRGVLVGANNDANAYIQLSAEL